MRVLVIPDIHLKPRVFVQASALMQRGAADRAVCLMDIPDDWGQTFNLDLYAAAYDAAIAFAKRWPETLWCYGNHDVCYLWNERESGYSKIASRTVCDKLRGLREALPDERQLAFMHRIDCVLFSHGGLAEAFVRQYVPKERFDDADEVLRTINGLGHWELWQDLSPIWYRPQYYGGAMYKEKGFLQIVGHTPVEAIKRQGNVISCDVFSTYRDGSPIGTQEFLLLDTVSWEYEGIM